MQRFLFLIPLTMAILLTTLLAIRLVNPETTPTSISMRIGEPLPNTVLHGLEEETTLSSEDFLGQYSLLNVFASWCAVCTIEHPQLMKLHNHAKLTLIGLNWKDRKEDAQHWLHTHGNPYKKIGWDYHGKWVIDLGVTGAPETFLISPEGRILYHHRGALTAEIIQQEFLARIP